MELARIVMQEFEVKVFDFRDLPRKKPCGGLLTERSMKLLKNIPEEVFSEPKTPELVYVDMDSDRWDHSGKRLGNVDRFLFDKWMLEACEGIQIIRERAENFKLGERVELFTNKRKYELDFLVDASGAFAFSKTKLGKRHTRFLAVQDWILPKENIDDVIFLYSRRVNPNYYFWAIPKGKQLIVGTAYPLSDFSTEKYLKERNEVLRFLKIQGRSTKRELHLITVPLSEQEIFIGEGKLLVIGEAAGLISASSGEGISFAIESARVAASVIQGVEKSFSSLKQRAIRKIEKLKKRKRNAEKY